MDNLKRQGAYEEQGCPFTNDGVSKKKYRARNNLAQTLATVGFGMLIFSVSTICTMATTVIGGLEKAVDLNETVEIEMSEQQKSWLGSVVYLVQPVGSIVSGIIQEIFGRRNSMMGVTIPQFIGWVILYFANDVALVYFAAVIMGLSVGFLEAPAMSYLGEVCEPRLRGVLAAFSECFLLFGILFEFAVGGLMYWRYACAVTALVPIIVFIVLYFLPESPTWLIVKNRVGEAQSSLRWLRGWVPHSVIRHEFDSLIDSINGTSHGSNQSKAVKQKPPSGICAAFKLLKYPNVNRPIFLVATYFFTAHCIGLLGMRPFLYRIFQSFNMPLDEGHILLATGSAQVIGSLFCMSLVRVTGKRPLTFISIGISTICCFTLSGYIYGQWDAPWVPMVLFIVIYFCNGLGLMPLPWTLVCEVFPLEGKGIASGLTAASYYIFAFIITKTYLELEALLSLSGVVLLYGLVGVAGFGYLFWKLPETEGKTFDEIQVYFNKQNSINEDST